MKSLKKIQTPLEYLLLLTLPVLSCGWMPIEEDSHPDWAGFPNLKSIGVTVETVDDIPPHLQKGDGFFLGLTNQKTLVAYQDEFKKQHQIAENIAAFEIIDGQQFYALQNKGLGEDDVLLRYDNMHQKPVPIEEHPLKADDKKWQALGGKEADYTNVQRAQAMALKRWAGGYTCAFTVKGDLIIRYPKNEWVVKGGEYNFKVKKELTQNAVEKAVFSTDRVFRQCRTTPNEAYIIDAPQFKRTDKVALSRTGHGNHMVAGFYCAGYSYYQLKLNGHTYQFKSKEENLDYPDLVLLNYQQNPAQKSGTKKDNSLLIQDRAKRKVHRLTSNNK
ncbi:MAG: hypothetical protein JXR91_07690 [Deltaproteobacteria bacterium]|nr:hypothetical protein [Deltaproteobacteria bacterium]